MNTPTNGQVRRGAQRKTPGMLGDLCALCGQTLPFVRLVKQA